MSCSTFWLLCLVFDFECLGRSEFFMVAPDNLTHEKFFAKSKSEQADLVLLPHFKKLMLSSSWLLLRYLCFCFLTFTSSQANRLNPHWHLLDTCVSETSMSQGVARPFRGAHSDFRGLPRSGNNPVQAHTVGRASRMSQR